MEKLLYRPKEAAQALGISRDKLYDLLRAAPGGFSRSRTAVRGSSLPTHCART